MTETEILFSEILNCSRHELYLNREVLLARKDGRQISSCLKRRLKGEPLQYILGKTEFMGLEFKVSPDVLIPRPETEILVETVLRLGARSKILDIGTGSGCVAISLAKNFSQTEIIAVDISEKALQIARENAELNKVKVNFMQGDLFKGQGYDVIVSNPPYIPSSQIQNLQPEIQFEPRIALDGGNDGLDFYRRIINESPAYLKSGGFLIMEIGFDQAAAIKNIFQINKDFEIIECVRDYNNLDRVIVAKKAG